MQLLPLTSDERRSSGFTHKAIVTFADVAALTSPGTLVLMPYTAGTLIYRFAFRQVTVFDGTTVEATMHVGWNGATTDDPDGLLVACVIGENGTEVLARTGDGAAFGVPGNATDSPLTGYIALDAGNIEAIFTATAGALSAFTSGELHIFLGVVDLAKL